MGGWLENEFLKKTPSPKFGLESQLGTSDLEFVNSITVLVFSQAWLYLTHSNHDQGMCFSDVD